MGVKLELARRRREHKQNISTQIPCTSCHYSYPTHCTNTEIQNTQIRKYKRINAMDTTQSAQWKLQSNFAMDRVQTLETPCCGNGGDDGRGGFTKMPVLVGNNAGWQ